MTAVVLACISALSFGAMTVALRFGLRRVPDAGLGTLATVLPAFAVALGAVAIGSARSEPLRLDHAWPFLLAGLLAPGGSQILFTLAVREAGPSRTSVAVGAAPLVAVAIALLALDEPASAPLLVGAVLIVAGGIALVGERGRPDHVRTIGLLYAFLATAFFASRDNLVRYLSGFAEVTRPGAACAATLLTGSAVAAVWYVAGRRRRPWRDWAPFIPAGVFFGLSYVLLFEAYYRGRVSVVAPLVATESLWGVVLSALLLRRSELVGRRLLVGAALIVGGGALIATFR